MCGFCSICSFCKTFQRNAQPSLEVGISRGLGICPNKSFDGIGAEAEISKTSIPGQECPACGVVKKLYNYIIMIHDFFKFVKADAIMVKD